MTRPGLAVVLAGALLASGCALTPTQSPSSAALTTETLKASIEQEIQSLLAGESGGRSLRRPDWNEMGVYRVQENDTVLGILEQAGAPASLFLELPPEDREAIAALQPGDSVVLIEQAGRFTGLAFDAGEGWRAAVMSMAPYALRTNVALEPPSYQVIDLPLDATLFDTLSSSQELSLRDQGELHKVLAPAFTDDSLPEQGWLRLRLAHRQLHGEHLGGPVLMSAALHDTVNEVTRYAVRFAAPGQAAAYYDGRGTRLTPTWLSTPISGEYRITSGFDPARRHPVTGRVRPHHGKDFAAPTGTRVVAASDGSVTHAGWRGSWGLLVVLTHDDGVETRYAHLSRIEGLAPGDRVAQGQVIGRVGSTGLSSGPHLHFEVLADGQHYDPATFHPEQLRSPGATQLAGSDMRGMQAYLELEGEALALLPEWPMDEFGPGFRGVGGPSAEDELPTQWAE